MPLSPKQTRFVEEYLLDLNASHAAQRAGYAATTSQKLMKNPDIRQEIVARLTATSEKLEISRDQVLREITRIAFNDPRRLFDTDGTLLPIQDWPDDTAAAVSSIKITEIKDSEGNITGQTKQIHFWDKGRHLDLAARHLGLLQDKLQISTPVSHLIRAGRQRLRQDDPETLPHPNPEPEPP